jgi:hypothetical protein
MWVRLPAESLGKRGNGIGATVGILNFGPFASSVPSCAAERSRIRWQHNSRASVRPTGTRWIRSIIKSISEPTRIAKRECVADLLTDGASGRALPRQCQAARYRSWRERLTRRPRRGIKVLLSDTPNESRTAPTIPSAAVWSSWRSSRGYPDTPRARARHYSRVGIRP